MVGQDRIMEKTPLWLGLSSNYHICCGVAKQERHLFTMSLEIPGIANWDAEVQPVFPDRPVTDDQNQRWDGTSLDELRGTYGEYLLGKVSKIFPELSRNEF